MHKTRAYLLEGACVFYEKIIKKNKNIQHNIRAIACCDYNVVVFWSV